MDLFWILLAVLAAIGGLIGVERVRAARRSHPHITDDMVRRVEEDGELWVEDDEPLDLESIREEEERFFDDWDEIEEW